MVINVLPPPREVPDDVWILIAPILNDLFPAKPKGHRCVDLSRVLNGLICRLRTGCQWNKLLACSGDDRTVHRHFQPWCQGCMFAQLWAVLVEACDDLGGVDWPWQAADMTMGKARTAGDLVGRDITDRGTRG